MTQRPRKNRASLIIIGGGASGLAAACICAKQQIPFLLLEKEQKLGRKLLATGNGRCNLLNTGKPVYFGDKAFAEQVLQHCGVQEVRAFFDELGLVLREEDGGRVYPATQQAATVLDCLLKPLENSAGQALRTGLEVTDLKKTQGGFQLKTPDGQDFFAPRVILATGSPAAPRLGGSDSLLPCLNSLGHHALPFDPSLCPLVCETKLLRGLAGLRVSAVLTLYAGERPVDAAAGEVLFTDYGVSGLCAMQLARAAREGLSRGLFVSLSINFSPLCGLSPPMMRRLALFELTPPKQNQKAMLALLQRRRQKLGDSMLYTGLLPWQMMKIFQGLSLPEAAYLLTDFRLKVQDTKGFEQAQAARGGLDCRQFEAKTLQSLLHPGLYATGEVLNVDGDTGGFNLLFAWATGILAGKDAAKQELPPE